MNDLLQSGKSATMLPSIAASSSGHWNHDGSRRWQRSTRPSVEPHPGQHIAAEALDEAEAFAAARRCASRRPQIGPSGRLREDLLDQLEALLDLADADPDAGIDVAVVQHRHVEVQLDRRAR